MHAIADHLSAEDRARNLVSVPLIGLATAQIPEQPFAIAGLVPRRVVTLLSGHGGTGKSILALTWCAHVACGRDWAGFKVERGRALYASLEDPGDTVRLRLRRIAYVFNLPIAEIERNLIVVDGTGFDPTLFAETCIDGVRSIAGTDSWIELQEIANGHTFIVIDNASDGYDADENSRRQVRAFMRQLTQLARETDAALVLLAHVDKLAARGAGNGSNFSGSTSWHNSARSRIALLKDGDDVSVSHEKSTHGRASDPLTLQWHPDGVLIGSRTESHGIERVTAQEADDAAIVAVIEAANAIGHDIKPARNGSLTGWHSIQTIECTPAWAKSVRSKPRFWEAINRLIKQGRIEAAQYHCTVSRKPKNRFEVRR